ncbi:hypothetical protein [Gloeobacter violaceus]|uniref:Glr4084 protein n=1 Tax=Gloeobacter violaceus (strain ATCC 29082 / PCC 7421) TaxID=251221 RepID=Q7NDZ8_GLOVI|nr:hypothetical protein [Gloeobacter violaceus]BAC92025.1 glr4084 [Gloeobacter violaceus PCC 7421]
MVNADILAEAAVWAALALIAWNFQGLVSRFPSFFLGVQDAGIALPTLYARILIAALACWEVLINAGKGNVLPPVFLMALTGYLLFVGWRAQGEAHLRWLGLYAATVAVVLCWQSLPSV